MSTTTISNKAFRLLALLHALPRAPQKKTCAQLQAALAEEGYDIGKRSVERDLRELSESQEFRSLIICDDRAQPYGWSIHPEKHLSIPGMNTQLATTWDLVQRYLKPLMAKDMLDKLSPVFTEAQRWLKTHRPTGSRPWSEKVAYLPRGYNLHPARVSAELADQVYEALHRNRQMDIWYKGNSEPQRVHPCALVDRGVARYLIVRFWDYEDYRQLALHRLSKVKILDDEASNSRQFDLQAYLREGGMTLSNGETIAITLRFTGRASDHLSETPISDDQKTNALKNGDTQLDATVEYSEELKWWILGFGCQVEVLSPASLREDIAQQAKLTHALYNAT
ncbi:helix-turn-helix transcriptional regulator [Alcanivorax hongdengensis]|nr:WYL domain-containing protein [Alcanivorax hongdengensis]